MHPIGRCAAPETFREANVTHRLPVPAPDLFDAPEGRAIVDTVLRQTLVEILHRYRFLARVARGL